MWPRFRATLLAVLVTGFYCIISSLWRYRFVRKPVRETPLHPRIYAHWHGDELALISHFRGRGLGVLSSRSRDGEMLSKILVWLGYRVARGSSSRGGAGGLKGLIDLMINEKASTALAVDGPRGPIYQVKPGIIKLAQETGACIYPGAVAASRRFVFKRAWNRCYLPLPFARCVIVYGEPMAVASSLSDTEFEGARIALEQKLKLLKTEAEAYFDRGFFPEFMPIQQTGV